MYGRVRYNHHTLPQWKYVRKWGKMVWGGVKRTRQHFQFLEQQSPTCQWDTGLHAGAPKFRSGQPTPLFDFTTSARASVSTLVPLASESQREQVLGDKQAAKCSKEWSLQRLIVASLGFSERKGCSWLWVGIWFNCHKRRWIFTQTSRPPEKHPLSGTWGGIGGLTIWNCQLRKSISA